MTSKKLQHGDVNRKPRFFSRQWWKNKITHPFTRRNCWPSLVEDIVVLREAKNEWVAVSKKEYGKAVGRFAGRIATSAAIHVGLVSTVGVTALQTEAGVPSTKWLHESSSPVAKGVASFVAALVPPHKKEMWANIMLSADMALSAIRIGVEQLLWKYCKITPDAPGTVVSPLVIGSLEMAYKTAALANTPDDPNMRLVQGFSGVYGNLIRFVGVGAIALGAVVWKRFSKKRQPPPGPCLGPKRNDFGIPMHDQ